MKAFLQKWKPPSRKKWDQSRGGAVKAPLFFRILLGVLIWVGLIALTQLSNFSDSRYYYAVLVSIFILPISLAWDVWKQER